MKSRKILKENRQDLFEDLEIEEDIPSWVCLCDLCKEYDGIFPGVYKYCQKLRRQKKAIKVSIGKIKNFVVNYCNDQQNKKKDGKMKKAKTSKTQISKSEDTKFVRIDNYREEKIYRITFKCDMSEFEEIEDFIDSNADIIKEEIEVEK